MACEDLVAGCFMDEQAPLAVLQDFLQQHGVPRQGVVRQLQLAKPLLQPWLD
jgi:hypothetical protein